MAPIWRVSDEEVWTTIRYLDPDEDNSGKPHLLSSEPGYLRWIKAGVLAMVLILILWIAGMRYLPAAMGFFR